MLPLSEVVNQLWKYLHRFIITGINNDVITESVNKYCD